MAAPRVPLRFSLLPLMLSILVERSHGEGVAITWESPSGGGVFKSGESIVAKWCSTPMIVSPSFTLCASHGEDEEPSTFEQQKGECGSTVWPTVERDGGCSVVTFTAPSVTSNKEYFFWMIDDSGTRSQTPTFAVHQGQSIAETAESQPLSAPNDEPQLPLSLQWQQGARSSDVDSASTSVAASSSLPTATVVPPSSNLVVPDHSPSKVALAVPFTILGVVVIIAIAVLLLRQRRTCRETHPSDSEKQSDTFSRSDEYSSKNLPENLSVPVSLFPSESMSSNSTKHALSPPLETTPTISSKPSALPFSSSFSSSPSYLPPISTSYNNFLDDTVTDSILSEYTQASPVIPLPFCSSLSTLPSQTEDRDPFESHLEDNSDVDPSPAFSPRSQRASIHSGNNHDGFESVPL